MLMPDTDFHRYAAECQHNDTVQTLANDKAYRAKLDAAAQADSMRRYMDMRRENPAKCPSYGCDAVLGPDSGVIDGDRYCADCVANEAEVAGREERKQNVELFARGGGNL